MTFKGWSLAAIVIVATLSVWQLLAFTSPFAALLVSSPLRLKSYFCENYQFLTIDLLHTLFIAGSALAIAIVLGSSLASVALLSDRFSRFLEAASTIAQSIPLIVFAPFTIILLGVGFASQIVLAAIMAIFPIIVGFTSAFRTAREEFKELAIFYNVPLLFRVSDLYVAYAVPSLVATIRISAGLSILGAVIAEFTGSAIGLGHNIFLGTVRLDPELMMSSLLLTSIVGVSVHLALRGIERRSSWWKD